MSEEGNDIPVGTAWGIIGYSVILERLQAMGATPEKRAPKSLLELGRDEWWREAGRWAWGTCWGSDGRWAEEEGARWRMLRESRLDHVMDEQKKVFIHHMIRTPVFL